MIHHTNAKMENKRDSVVLCSSFVVDNDEAWVAHLDFNALLKVNLKTEKTYYITSFEEDKEIQSYLFIKVLKIGRNVILIPGFAKNIYIYDTEEERVVYKRSITDIYKTPIAFCDACIIENKIYCFPYEVNKPITIIDIHDFDEELFIELSNNTNSNGYYNKCIALGNVIYAVNPLSNYLTCVDTENNRVSYILVDISGGMSAITANGNCLYIQTINSLIKYNPFAGRIENSVCLKSLSGASGSIGYYDMNKIWVDTNGYSSYIVDFDDNIALEQDKLEFGKQLVQPQYKTGPNYSGNESFYYYNNLRSSIIKLDLHEKKEIQVRLVGEELKRINREIVGNAKGKVIIENCSLGLSDFLETL